MLPLSNPWERAPYNSVAISFFLVMWLKQVLQYENNVFQATRLGGKKMNPVVHFEMPYDDHKRVEKFYKEVFGWQMKKLGEDMGNYVLATTANADVKPDLPRGAINGGFYQRKPDWPGQYPSVVIALNDIKEAMKQVEEAGGKVLGEPVEIPGIGLYVSFTDTEDNRVSMLQPNSMDVE
jgi:predicted enzyme related to lactoylglutathione lyase